MWGVEPANKTPDQIASEGLNRMEQWMNELGLVMTAKDLGVTEDMIDSLAESTLIMEGGFKVLAHDEIVEIFKASMK